jgi:hypothetical protein
MKEHVFGCAAVLVLVLASAQAVPGQEGKKVTSHNGACQVTVPADWEVSG